MQDMMWTVIKQGRQAVRVGGRCDLRQLLLTEHLSYLLCKDMCLRKQTGGRCGDMMQTWTQRCMHAPIQMHQRSSVSSHITVIFVYFYFMCVPVCACINVCLTVQAQQNLLTACMATEGRKSDTWEPRRGQRRLECSLWAPQGKRQTFKTAITLSFRASVKEEIDKAITATLLFFLNSLTILTKQN